MNHDQLDYDLARAPSLRLLAGQNAPLVVSFLYRHFKQEQHLNRPYADLVQRLEQYLDALAEQWPGRYTATAATYMKQWCDDDHRFLRTYTRGSIEPSVELTADTERALGWVEELQQRTFIGTESRFLTIFGLLDEIAVRSSTDVTERLAQLEKQKADIQREIDTITATGEVTRYTTTQIRERFAQANTVARQLVGDFAAVEQNFAAIAREVQLAQLAPAARKGAVVETVLDADAKLKDSDEGRSFYAFWEFLLSPSKQDELRDLLDRVYDLPDLADTSRDSPILRHITRNLLEAGDKIVQSNHRLAEQLRRMLDERNIAEGRRVRELVAEIKRAALARADAALDDATFIELDGLPDVQLPMEKELWEPTEPVAFAALPALAADSTADVDDLARLYSQFHVDDNRLRAHIEALLDDAPQTTLADILARYPAEQGLSEIIAYMTLAAKEPRHHINPAQAAEVVLSTAPDPTRVTVPQVIFRRTAHEQ